MKSRNVGSFKDIVLNDWKKIWSAFKLKVTNLFKTLTFLVNNVYWCGQKTFGDSSYKQFSMVE